MDEKIVIIGAGSAMFTQGLISDLIRIGSRVELALVDIDPAALEVVVDLVYGDKLGGEPLDKYGEFVYSESDLTY